MRGWYVRLVVAVISRVVTVLVGAALVLEVIIAMTMIVLIRGRPSMRVCSRTQGCARQGCCARECEQGMREHQQPNQHSRQRASDPFREDRGGQKKGHVGSGSGRQAGREPFAIRGRFIQESDSIRQFGNTRKRARAKGIPFHTTHPPYPCQLRRAPNNPLH